MNFSIFWYYVLFSLIIIYISQELSEIHRTFLNQLRKAVTIPGSPIKLSEVFISWKEKFLIYGEYCANLTLAQQRIQDLCSRDEKLNQEVIVSDFLVSFIFLKNLNPSEIENVFLSGWDWGTSDVQL